MNQFDAELILEMTRNIKNCPDDRCSACSGSIDVINKQVQTALARYEKLEAKLEKRTSALRFYKKWSSKLNKSNMSCIAREALNE